MKKRLISMILTLAVCLGMIVPALAAPAAASDSPEPPTLEEALEWLNAQKDQYYDLDGKYGAQCSDLVTAYMNWLIDRYARSGRYLVYNANYYPTVAGWRPDLWEVIANTPEFVPQPGDIFVSRGSASYGHTGIVLSSTVSTATVIDQNSINSNETTGHSAYIHQITWSGGYAPTYFIRYRHYAAPQTPPACSHSYRTGAETAHPHQTYQICDNCGEKQYTGSSSYSSDCEACNPPDSCDHSYLYLVEASHPHRAYQRCIDCGDTRYTDDGSYSSDCESCNASCSHSYLNCIEGSHPHRTYQYCVNCGDKRYTSDSSYLSTCESCNPSPRWTDWSAWSADVPTQTGNREVEKRETVEGYNLVVYVTQEAAYPHHRNFRNYSVNGNYDAYGLRSSYGEFAYSRYATKAELEAAETCREGDYVRQDGAHVGGYYRGNGTAYYFPDGYYWYIDSDNPVTKTEYRFRDRLSVT